MDLSDVGGYLFIRSLNEISTDIDLSSGLSSQRSRSVSLALYVNGYNVFSESVLSDEEGHVVFYGLGDLVFANAGGPSAPVACRLDLLHGDQLTRKEFTAVISPATMPPYISKDIVSGFLTTSEGLSVPPRASFRVCAVGEDIARDDLELSQGLELEEYQVEGVAAVFHIKAPAVPGVYAVSLGPRRRLIVFCKEMPGAHHFAFRNIFGVWQDIFLNCSIKYISSLATSVTTIGDKRCDYDQRITNSFEFQGVGVPPVDMRSMLFFPSATQISVDGIDICPDDWKSEWQPTSDALGEFKFTAQLRDNAIFFEAPERIFQSEFDITYS